MCKRKFHGDIYYFIVFLCSPVVSCLKDILLLSMISCPSLFCLVNVIANVLMRCVVAMVSNVSDSSNPWSGMLLYTHMLKHSVMPQRECHTHICMHTCIYSMHKHTLKGLHVCLQIHKKYACKSAKWCMSGRNSCSFLHKRRNFLLLCCRPRPASQDINQSAMLRLNAGS